MTTPAGFKSIQDKGFHITFENGYTVSVQFGYGNYCENRDKLMKKTPSVTAEIAYWKDGELIAFKTEDGEFDDTVKGWQSPEQVLAFMNMVSSLTE